MNFSQKLAIVCINLGISKAEVGRRMWPDADATDGDTRPQRLSNRLKKMASNTSAKDLQDFATALGCTIETVTRPGEETELVIVLPDGQRI